MKGPVSPLRVLESCLYAEDLDRAQDFYSKVLGLEVFLPANRREVFFRCGESMVLIFNPTQTQSNPVHPAEVPAHGAIGPGHLAFAVKPDELETWRTRLLVNGVAIESEVHWPNGAVSLYFRDPAGNCLELTVAALWQHSPQETTRS